MSDDRRNRRQHPRIQASLPVRISTIEPERDPWTGRPFFRASQETCANVSRGGAFVRTSEPLAPGRRILVELKLPNGTPLEAIGRVAWTKRVMTAHKHNREAGVGIEFLGGGAEHFSALQEFIDRQAED
jgi:hypothetical protein